MAVGSKELATVELDTFENDRLVDELKKAKEELFNLRFQSATGQLESHGRLRAVKRDIARIYTVIRERELGIRATPVAVEVRFDSGVAERVVVEWRNRFVGFVPTSHLASVRGQLVGAAAGKSALTANGRVYFDGRYFRVWVGPPPEDGFPQVEAGYDELSEPSPAIFGIPLSRLRNDR